MPATGGNKPKEAQEATAVKSSTSQGPVIEESTELDQQAMMEAYDLSFKNIAEGEIIKGTVLKITGSRVVVDVGFKSEGTIALEEFIGETGQPDVEPGDTVEVLLERTEDRHGNVVISRQKAERLKVWEELEQAYQDQSNITGRIIERIKGGLTVDVGVRAFLPGSQVDLHPVRNLDSWCGQELPMRVIKVSRRRGNIVLSRKAVLEEEYFRLKEETLKDLEEGKIIDGAVKNITDYGAFVDLGGLDGLLHITDMSWGRVNHPSDLFVVGDEIQVKVLKFDRLQEKVSLGYKQLSEDPWLTASRRYPKGNQVSAKVVSLTDYGAFVELEEGIEGLIHVSEMSWNKRVKHPSKLVSAGADVEAIVLEVDSDARRISLGLKQLEANPWEEVEGKYAINSIVTGSIQNLTDFGAFVEVEDGIEGLVHISDISWTKKIQHPAEVLERGQEVSAVVLNVDAENQRLSLGIKQLEPDKWEEFFSQRQIGDVVQGKIVRLTDFGAFVEISEGVEGLCHISELAEEHIDSPENHFKIDQELDVKIIKMNLLERKIGLSIRALKETSGEEDSWSYTPEVATTSIGEIAGNKLDQLKKKTDEEKGGDNDES